MANAINMRATSIGASALLISAALVAALTATISVQTHSMGPEPDPFLMRLIDPPRPVTPPPARPTTPRPQQNTEPTNTDQPTPQLSQPRPVDASFPLDPVSATGPVEITNPFWAHRPANLDRFYPARAISRGIEGRAELDCLVAITGTLSCTVVSETPAGWGFGDAALRIAREYSMRPAMRNGTPVSGHYRMNVPFTLR